MGDRRFFVKSVNKVMTLVTPLYLTQLKAVAILRMF
jgi:hypothetical protein